MPNIVDIDFETAAFQDGDVTFQVVVEEQKRDVVIKPRVLLGTQAANAEYDATAVQMLSRHATEIQPILDMHFRDGPGAPTVFKIN